MQKLLLLLFVSSYQNEARHYMHGRRSVRQKLLIQFDDREEHKLQIEQDKSSTREITVKETMADKAKDGKDQNELTLKELSAPSDYEAFTRISAPLNDNANFKIDATMLNFLPSFHGRFSDEPYEFLREFTQFCSSYYFPGISQEAVKLMLLPFALKDRAREWLNGTGKTFTTWQEVQTSFLQKYFSYGRTHALRKAIRDFTQGNETFGEAWERFMILTRKCPHHGIPDHELAQIFYQGLDYQERQLVDISSGGNFLNTRANESLKRMEEFVEDWVFRQSSIIDSRTGGIKRGVIDVKGMETEVKMERMEREMKQSLLEITKNFKHLLKDALSTIKPEANVSKVQVNSSCGMCASNDHLQEQCKAIQTEQVNAFGQHQNTSNWHAGSKMINHGHNNIQQGIGMQHHQPKMQGQLHVHQNTQYYQNQPPPYQNLQFHHGQPQFQHGQQFHQNALISHPGAPNYVNHSSNQNLWETVKRLQDKERAWEEEKKLLLTHIEMLKSTQGMVMMSEEPREQKNKGKLEESSAKGNFSGQFPTKPCVNPRNLSYNNITQLNTCNSFIVSKNAKNMNFCQEHEKTNRSLNSISCLRNGKMLPNIIGKKQKRLEQEEEKNQTSVKEVLDSEVIPESREEKEKKEERSIPFPNALTSTEKKT